MNRLQRLEAKNEHLENYIELLLAYIDSLEAEQAKKSEFLKATMVTLLSERDSRRLEKEASEA